MGNLNVASVNFMYADMYIAIHNLLSMCPPDFISKISV